MTLARHELPTADPANQADLFERKICGAMIGLRLTPRQDQTVRFLLFGLGEKQIAARLGVSRHTVHEHVKAIYRDAQVSSRGELLAKFLKAALLAAE